LVMGNFSYFVQTHERNLIIYENSTFLG
jgi:hypothetical protein